MRAVTVYSGLIWLGAAGVASQIYGMAHMDIFAAMTAAAFSAVYICRVLLGVGKKDPFCYSFSVLGIFLGDRKSVV